MGSLFRKLIDLITPAPAAPAELIYVGAFGKHPAWDDHIDDIGVATDHLAQAKRAIYIDGIGGNIDAGAWDTLDASGNAIPFDHAFLWRRSGAELMIGRIWASRDGKGRSRYPMVLCAQCHDVPLQRALSTVLPALEKIKTTAVELTDADAVRGLIDQTEQELRAALADLRAPVVADGQAAASKLASTTVVIGPPKPSAAAKRLATSTLMGARGRGLLSVLYQIDREMIAFCRPTLLCSAPQEATVFLNSGLSHGPQPLRVPATESSMNASVALWFDFAMDLLEDDSSLVMIWPVPGASRASRNWIDLIIGGGEPSPTQLRCIRSAPAAMPMTTEIPYTLDATFLDRAGKFVGIDFDPTIVKPQSPHAGDIASSAARR